MISFSSIQDLVTLAENRGQGLAAVAQQYEAERGGRSAEEVRREMAQNLTVMRQAVADGLQRTARSFSGMTGGDARRLDEWRRQGHTVLGGRATQAMAYALAVSEVNAGMGRVVACPTAGSCGIIPGALLAGAPQDDEDTLLAGLFTAAGVGLVIEERACLAGAEGGCQAECGAAAAMAAAAVTAMHGGTPRQSVQAATLALKNLLGLVCDPVAGLVEVPCVKRNAFGAVHALVAADMALAGVESVIPPDEVIDAMYRIGRALPPELRETARGGLAQTPTGRSIAARLFGQGDEGKNRQ